MTVVHGFGDVALGVALGGAAPVPVPGD